MSNQTLRLRISGEIEAVFNYYRKIYPLLDDVEIAKLLINQGHNSFVLANNQAWHTKFINVKSNLNLEPLNKNENPYDYSLSAISKQYEGNLPKLRTRIKRQKNSS